MSLVFASVRMSKNYFANAKNLCAQAMPNGIPEDFRKISENILHQRKRKVREIGYWQLLTIFVEIL